MVTDNNFASKIKSLKDSKTNITFAELVADVLKDKIVEVYIGDTNEDVKYDDSTKKYISVLIGRVVAAYNECLVLDCAYIDQASGALTFGNIVCLNERAIRILTEVDDKGLLRDTFLSTRDSKLIKDLYKGK